MSRKLALLALTTCLWMVTMSPALADSAQLVAYMSGAAVVPGPGDPDASGRTVVTIDDPANRICVVGQWSRVDASLTELQLREGGPAATGPVVAYLYLPPSATSGQIRLCGVFDNEVAEAILDHMAAAPGDFYAEIRSTPTYDNGAIRGQLQAA